MNGVGMRGRERGGRAELQWLIQLGSWLILGIL